MITRTHRALAKVFFGRLFENDMFSSSAAASASVTWLLAIVATPGVMFSATQVFSWAHLRAMGIRLDDPLVLDSALLRQQAFHIDFVMALAGIVTMMVWSSMTPDRRDALVLGPLPVTAREQAVGRVLALLKFFGMFIFAVTVPTAVAFHFIATGPESIFNLPARVLGHIIAAFLAGGSVFALLLVIQLIVASTLGPRAIRAITLPLQLAALLGIVAALGTAESMGRRVLEPDMANGAAVMWNPAAWFVGVYRYVQGDERQVFTVLAGRGLLAGAGLISVALVLYPLLYERCLRNVIAGEGRTGGSVSRGWTWIVALALRPFLRTPLQRGLATFMLATLSRSQTHRFVLGIYGAIAFLLSLPAGGRLLLQPSTSFLQYAWFAIPLGLVFWMVCGVRVCLMMPVEVAANWVFKLTEPVDKRRVLSTAVTVMTAVTCVPIAAIFAGILLLIGEQRLALTSFVVTVLAGLCLIELLTLTMKAAPFTCTYLPGQLKLRYLWAVYFVLWLNFVFRLTDWSVWALASWDNAFRLWAALLIVWIGLRAWHMVRVQRIRDFVYDELEPPLVTTMDVSTLMRQI